MSDSVLLDDDHPVDPDDELLVAYLDGELDDEARKSVERRLVGEDEFRRRLQSLQTGWEWLEELPSETTNEKLVESTIELVVSDIAPAAPPPGSWLSRHRNRVLGVSFLLVAFVAGVVGTAVARRFNLYQELDELEIAENHDAYNLGTNFAFFRELAYNERWQQMILAMEKIEGQDMTSPSVIAPIPVRDRRELLPSLPEETRSKLDARWNAYLGFSEETKLRLKQTARRVAAADDGERLLTTMKAAAIWMEGLSDELRDQMMSEDETVRREAIEEAIDFTMSDLSRDSGKLISDDTANRIYLYLQMLLAQRLEGSRQNQARISRLVEGGAPLKLIEFGLMQQMIGDWGRFFSRWRYSMGSSRFGGPGFPSRGRGPGPPPPGPGGPNGKPPQRGDSEPGPPPPKEPPKEEERPEFPRVTRMTAEEFLEMRNVLSDQALQDLETFKDLRSIETLEASAGLGEDVINEYALVEMLRSWSTEALMRNVPRLDEKPIDRYREYENRDTLDLLDPDRILDEVYWNRRWRSSRRPR